jgi:hypothetical protein
MAAHMHEVGYSQKKKQEVGLGGLTPNRPKYSSFACRSRNRQDTLTIPQNMVITKSTRK